MPMYGPHRLICLNKPMGVECSGLNIVGPGSRTIRRYVLAKVGMPLLKEVCYFGGGF